MPRRFGLEIDIAGGDGIAVPQFDAGRLGGGARGRSGLGGIGLVVDVKLRS